MSQQSFKNDDSVLTMLDICGSCITDIVYNGLFDKAIAIHEKNGIGIAEAYRQVLAFYVKESNTPKFYSEFLNMLYHYVRISTVFDTMSYPDCISTYAGFFVPRMYAASMTSEQKLNILTMVLGHTINEFITKINTEYISCIIDNHQDPINIEILQDAVLKIIITQRNKSYDKFIQSQADLKPVEAQKPSQPKCNKQVITNSKAMMRISTAFKKSIAKKTELEKKNKDLAAKNKQLSKQFMDLKELFLKHLNMQKEQNKTINDLKNQLLTQQRQPIPEVNQETKSDKVSFKEDGSQKEHDKHVTIADTVALDDNNIDDLFSVEYVE